MALKAGIVGLPNVGKSTLFNAVSTSAKAQASNYRFCTIEPNIGLVDVPDQRLDKLAELVHPEPDRTDANRDRGYCRTGKRRQQGRRAGQ